MAIPLLFGGMSPSDVAAALGMMLVTAVTLGSISIAVSSRARSSRGAVAGSYAVAFVIGFLSLAVFLGELFLAAPSEQSLIPIRGREFFSSWVNPFVGMVDAIRQPLKTQTNFNFTPFLPFDAIVYARQGVSTGGIAMPLVGGFGQAEGAFFGRDVAIDIAQAPGGVSALDVRIRRGPVWMRTLIIYLALTALALFRASYVVRAPAQKILVTKRRRDG
jgi:ABC-type transport system involved in multi-copper enzyme maturation permease subunit